MQVTLLKSYSIKEIPKQSTICISLEIQTNCITSKNNCYPNQQSISFSILSESVLNLLIKNWLFSASSRKFEKHHDMHCPIIQMAGVGRE